MAIILHDIGKLQTCTMTDDGKITFLGHENASSSIARKELQKLRFSNDEIEYIDSLIKYHMMIHTIEMNDERNRYDALAELYIRLRENADLLIDIITFAKLDDNDKMNDYQGLIDIVVSFETMPRLIAGNDVISYPDWIKGDLIKRMRYLQLSKGLGKQELLKYMKSEEHNIRENRKDENHDN